MSDPLLDSPRALIAKVAAVLGGSEVEHELLSGYVNSRFDPFLNQLFATDRVPLREAAAALEGHPGFVWLTGQPDASEADADLSVAVMHGMTASTGGAIGPSAGGNELVEVRSQKELRQWYAVYSEVFGAHARGGDDWSRINHALGPDGDGSLLLVLARCNGSPAATGAVYLAEDAAGLYCFTTREPMRGRGLALALLRACHAAARARGIERALLQATPMARPVYAKAGYEEERQLPVLVLRNR
jgi:GNAT superfamily N-acetyltransferase